MGKQKTFLEGQEEGGDGEERDIQKIDLGDSFHSDGANYEKEGQGNTKKEKEKEKSSACVVF